MDKNIWYNNLISTVYNGTYQELIDISEPIFNNPIFIRNNSYYILAVSTKPCPEDPYHAELKKSKILPKHFIDNLKKNHIPSAQLVSNARPYVVNFDPSKPDLLTMPVYVDDIPVCYVSIVQIKRSFTEEDSANLITLSRAISVVLQKKELFNKNLGMEYETFLSNILDKDIHAENELDNVYKRIENFNFQTFNNFFIGIYGFKKPDMTINQIRILTRELSYILPNTIFCIKLGKIVSLASSDTDFPYNQSQLNRLTDFLEQYGIQAIFSSGYEKIGESATQYTYLKDIYKIGSKMYPERTIIKSQELFVYQLFSLAGKSPSLLSSQLSPALQKLSQYDEKKSSSLMLTLYHFLMSQQDASLASEKLNIHKNTLFYRINRIKEITNIDLNDAETIFQTLLAFKLIEYRNIVINSDKKSSKNK